MKNLGIAQVNVQISDFLPNIDKNAKKKVFDISAYNWKVLNESPLFPALLAEQIQDENDSFAVILPSKRKAYIDNFMDGSSQLSCNPNNYITWKPTMVVKGSFNKILPDYDAYSGTIPVNQTSGIPDDWKGPIWRDTPQIREPFPNDSTIINEFFAWTGVTNGNTTTTTTSTTTPTACSPIPKTSFASQTQVRDGMWWAIESSPFLYENMPFWVTIKKPERSPTSAKRSSFIVIQIGKNDPQNQFDIWLGNNLKPRIIDYLLPASGSGTIPTSPTATPSVFGNPITPNSNDKGLSVEFLHDQSKILDTMENIEVGVMTIGGRLIVFVNGHSYVYTRIDKSSTTNGGSLLEAKIVAGSVSIYGTNIQANINISPMVFSPLSIMALPIPSEPQSSNLTPLGGPSGTLGGPTGSFSGSSSGWYGVDKKGDPNGLVCQVPSTTGTDTQMFGCDCLTFYDESGSTVAPSGLGYHKLGFISFSKGTASTFPALPLTDFYYLVLTSQDIITSGGTIASIPNGGCPFFFRLNGLKKPVPISTVNFSGNVSDLVVSLDETASAPDYFHVKKSLTVTLYNPGGNLLALARKQGGIQVSWGWDGNSEKTFTGVITNVSTSSVAGKEMVTLSCEDYMYVLKNMQIVNSPFYDGMVAYYAIKDLAERAGMDAPIKVGQFGDDFFLPSGFSFTKPAVKFSARQSLFECMMYIVKRFETFLYFDENGKLNIEKLPGGLFSVTVGANIKKFSSDPSVIVTTPTTGLILTERNAQYNYDSTISNINIITLDRNTRNVIIYGKSDTHGILAYNRTWLYDEPAFGELEAAKAWADDASKRMFKPIIKTTFKTAGDINLAKPLDFVEVDGQNFRLMSVKRTFNAETNDFTCSYEGEWLGG